MYSRSGGHVIAVESNLAAAVSGVSGNDHALAGILALHHRAGGQVGHNGDLFADQQRKQGAFLGYINYIASNNGFTLADLFMYNDKHNEENGEQNLDGSSWNFSNNYGVEGPTRKRYINALRKLNWRNAVLMLMLAQGVPLLWSGDEMGNSQNGNNNAYCQDNPTG